jgi:chemotaxis protein methyltransferase CheR
MNLHLIHQLAASAGLRLREQDLDALMLWTAERLRKLALPGIEQYAQLLSQDSAVGRQERELLTVRCTTGESYFFRDPGQIDLLATKLLPELIMRRARTRTLRLWSAGCASGEEAYSLAMLVDELAPRLAGWRVLILGTDINREALQKARRGVYREWSFRALDAQRKQRYFEPLGDQWQIAPRLRDRVDFRHLDLVRSPFPEAASDLAEFDLILCRNVFIYLDAHAVGGITAKFSQALADGGYLVTGHGELFGHDTPPLHMRVYAQSAVFQKNSAPQTLADPWLTPQLAYLPTLADLAPTAAIMPPLAPPAPIVDAAPAAPKPNIDQLMHAAREHANRGSSEQAEQDCRQALALSDLDPRPYFLLARLAQARGDSAAAKTLLKKVIYLDASFVAACLELGALHSQDGEHERARRLYETARAALRKLPAQSLIAPYNDSSVADALVYLERLLDATEAAVSASLGSKM